MPLNENEITATTQPTGEGHQSAAPDETYDDDSSTDENLSGSDESSDASPSCNAGQKRRFQGKPKASSSAPAVKKAALDSPGSPKPMHLFGMPAGADASWHAFLAQANASYPMPEGPGSMMFPTMPEMGPLGCHPEGIPMGMGIPGLQHLLSGPGFDPTGLYANPLDGKEQMWLQLQSMQMQEGLQPGGHEKMGDLALAADDAMPPGLAMAAFGMPGLGGMPGMPLEALLGIPTSLTPLAPPLLPTDFMPPPLAFDLPPLPLPALGPLDVLPAAPNQQMHQLQTIYQKLMLQLRSLEEQVQKNGEKPEEHLVLQQHLLQTRRQLQLHQLILSQLSQPYAGPDDQYRPRLRSIRPIDCADHIPRHTEWIGGKPSGIIQRKHSGWLVLFRSHSRRLRPDCPSKTFYDREIPGATLQEIQLESYQRAFGWRNAVSSEKGMTKNEYCVIDHPDTTKQCRYLVVKAFSKASGTPRVIKFITDYKYRAVVDKTTWTPKFNRGKVYITSRERTAEVPNGKITHFAKALMMEEGLKPEAFEQKFLNGEPRDLRFQNLAISTRPIVCSCWDPMHTRYTKSPSFDNQARMIPEQNEACVHQTLSEFQWIVDKSDTLL